MITTVAFDLDDTLYDEVDYCRSGFQSVAPAAAHLSDGPSSNDVFVCLWRHFISGNRTETFDAALEELGIPHDARTVAQLVETYRRHYPSITLPPESRDTLEKLQRQYRLALLTDGFLPAQQLKVRALGLESDFEAIVYTEELGREFWKPSPAGFEKLIDMLGVPPEQMVYVGDNEKKDFIAPNQLGMLTVQLRRPARLHVGSSQDPGGAAKLKIDKLGALPTLLSHY